MKLKNDFYKTALFLAVEKENVKLVKYLLMNDNIDFNIINISSLFFLIELKITYFNCIHNDVF